VLGNGGRQLTFLENILDWFFPGVVFIGSWSLGIRSKSIPGLIYDNNDGGIQEDMNMVAML
jgi:hypothetical protein